MANDEYSGQDANTDADAESTVDSAPEQQDPDSVEPSPEAGIMPVVRPAVTLPNPDVQARQIAPQVRARNRSAGAGADVSVIYR